MIAALDSREVKRRASFVAIASRYMRLRQAGGQYRGLCPFHRESDPSLYIEPQRKIWKCFGCERGGDVFDFVMLTEGCSFAEAVRIVSGIASGSERQSRELFDASERGAAPSARAAGWQHSPNSHTSILAALDATEKRNSAIRAANDAAFAEFERACEPRIGEAFLLVNKQITGQTLTPKTKTDTKAKASESTILAVSNGSQ